jgi:plastocyanin
MTWALPICFSLCLPLAAATVTARVQLLDSQQPDARAGKDFSGVAVWLERSDGSPPLLSPSTVKMVQKNKRFSPRVLAVPTGTTVDFPNLDPIFHNAFSNFSGQPFDVGLYAPGSTQLVQFRREGVVRVFCNIHPTMSAVIVVVKTPYAAVSNRAGALAISNVEPGEYRLKVFHERSTDETLRALVRTIKVEGPGVSLGTLAISESGYITTPHKNKHGKDYPPVIVDTPIYSGKRP